MSELPDTSTKEGQLAATLILAKLMPHTFAINDKTALVREATDEHGFAFFGVNLYDPKNMRLAWEVLNWAHEYAYDPDSSDYIASDMYNTIDIYFRGEIWGNTARDAQRGWLDAVLRLVISNGLIDAAANGATL